MEIIISNNANKPIYEQITSQIKAMIMSGELAAGDAIPSMRALAKAIHVSVITVQKAYEDLQRDGFIEASGIGLLSWFMKQSGTINGFTKAMWTGQTTVQLAKTMEYVAKERMGGLYNAVPHNSISKYELLKLFNKYLRDNSVTINPVEGIVADKSLVPSKLGDDFEIPNYEQMVAEMALWMRAHKEMYPHYEL